MEERHLACSERFAPTCAEGIPEHAGAGQVRDAMLTNAMLWDAALSPMLPNFSWSFPVEFHAPDMYEIRGSGYRLGLHWPSHLQPSESHH